MNDRQEDELMALSAIFDTAVSWTVLSAAGEKVQVRMKVEIDMEEERDCEMWDWEEPPPAPPKSAPSLTLEGVNKLPQGLADLNLSREGRTHPVAGSNTGRGRRKGRGRVAPNSSNSPSDRSTAASSTSRLPPVPPIPPVIAQPIRKSVVITLGPKSSNGSAPAFLPPSSPPPALAPPLDVPLPSEKLAAATKPESKKLRLRYLPPLEILATLSSSYPETSPPAVQIRDDAGWLDRQTKEALESRLAEVWQPGEDCLWMMYDLLSPSSLLATLSLSFPLVLRQTSPDSTAPPTPLSAALALYDRSRKGQEFAAGTYDCSLCLSTLKGRHCTSLPCSSNCTFCTPCLSSYFTLLITEGSVRSVCCPSEGCTKSRLAWEKEWAGKEATPEAGSRPGEIDEETLRGLVGEEVAERWRILREKQRWEADPTMSFCPRASCRTPCPAPSDTSSNLRICPSPRCSYAYCQLCLFTWHGSHVPCVLPASSAIVTAWLDGEEGGKEREALERRYGRDNVRRLVRVHEEERDNREWMESRTKACTGCKAPVEKSHGCSHMTCTRCGSHFCFRCGYSLRGDPYQHFNTPGSSCYMKLFDFRDTVGGGELPAEVIAEALGEGEVRPVEPDLPGEWEAMGEWHGERWNPFT